MASFSVDAMVRGYHVYRDIWTAAEGEEFPCKREVVNAFDPFAVAVMRGDTVIGHVPRKISSICSLFLRKEGSITCQVAGCKRYSEDLPQGGLEVPCLLRFEGDTKVTDKAKKLVESALSTTTVDLVANKRRKVSNPPTILLDSDEECSPMVTKEWVRFGKGLVLTTADKDHILAGEKLNDRHINFAQNILKEQFCTLGGLQSTLLQAKSPKQHTENSKKVIQVIHSRGDHWIVAALIPPIDNVVLVYDTVYNTIDQTTKKVIFNLFSTSKSMELVPVSRQKGGVDCGVFAVAIATALAHQQNPALIEFAQSAMQPHLVACFESGQFSSFPTV